MAALYKLADQVEHYKTNRNGGHFTLKPTITVNNPLQKQLTESENNCPLCSECDWERHIIVLAKDRPTVYQSFSPLKRDLLTVCGGTVVTTQQHTRWQTDASTDASSAGLRLSTYPSPCHPPSATLKCELHIRQNACDNPRSLLLIQCRSPTHALRNFEAYFFFEEERGVGF